MRFPIHGKRVFIFKAGIPHCKNRVDKPYEAATVSQQTAYIFHEICRTFMGDVEWLIVHYNDVIMRAMASQIPDIPIVCSIICWGTDKKHQNFESLAFVRGLHRWQVDSPHKGPVPRKMFPFDDVLMQWPHCELSRKPPGMFNLLHYWEITIFFANFTRFRLETTPSLIMDTPLNHPSIVVDGGTKRITKTKHTASKFITYHVLAVVRSFILKFGSLRTRSHTFAETFGSPGTRSHSICNVWFTWHTFSRLM